MLSALNTVAMKALSLDPASTSFRDAARKILSLRPAIADLLDCGASIATRFDPSACLIRNIRGDGEQEAVSSVGVTNPRRKRLQ